MAHPGLLRAGTLWHVARVEADGATLYSLPLALDESHQVKVRRKDWEEFFERAKRPTKSKTPHLYEAWLELEIQIDRETT